MNKQTNPDLEPTPPISEAEIDKKLDEVEGNEEIEDDFDGDGYHLGMERLNTYTLLSEPIPEEEKYEYEEDGKKFTGYNTQYAINLLNDTVGFGNWLTKEEIIKEDFTRGAYLVVMKLELSLFNDEDEVLNIVTGYGASYAKKAANAYKGAKTSAFKNACKYLGIGKELYKDSEELVDTELPTDNQPDTTIAMDNEANELMGAIKGAKTEADLRKYEGQVKELPSGKVAAIVVNAFNKKLIELSK